MTTVNLETREGSRHSGLGVASIVFSVLALFAIAAAATMLFGIALASEPEGIMDDSAVDILGGLALLGLHVLALCLNLLGLGFAVGGLWQGRRKKTLAIVGTVLVAATFLILVLSFWGQTSWFSANKYY